MTSLPAHLRKENLHPGDILMPKPPRLALFNAEEQKFYSELSSLLRLSPETLWRKLLCICSFVSFFGSLPRARGQGRRELESSSTNKFRVLPSGSALCSITNPPIDLELHATLTCEQNPEMLQLLHSGQLRGTIHHFPKGLKVSNLRLLALYTGDYNKLSQF